MSDLLPEGTLVRLVYDELEKAGEQEIVEDAGYLWIIHEVDEADDGMPYRCRSIATGMLWWFAPDEVETNDG